MADMLRMTDLTLKNVENAQLYTLQVPQHVNESCSSDITGTMAGLLFHKIEEHFTRGGLPKVKTLRNLGYAESLFVLSECGMLKDLVEQAKVAKGITLNRMTLFDNVSTTAYNKSVSDSTLAKMASIAPNNLTPSQKVRFMEILSTGVPEDETLGRTSPALSQATCTSEDSQHSQSTELSTGKATVSWTHEAILLLVDRRRALSHLFDSSTVTGRQSWQKVAEELRAKGHDYTCEDCRKKMVSLKMRHKTIKEKNGMTGERRNMWRYYGLMEEMFANDPAIIPKTVVCSLRQAQSAPSAAQSAPSATQSAPSATQSAPSAAQSAPSTPINESSAGDMSVLEEESADLPFITSTPRTGTRKRRRSGYDDEAPQWFDKYQQAQQKMHEEKMALESRRVSALETLVTLLQGQSANK